MEGLTREGLERLLALLDSEPGSAAEKLEALRRKLVNFFRLKGHLRPEEGADETIDRVTSLLVQGKVVDDIMRYSFGVARNVSSEYYRARAREQSALEHYQFVRAAAEAVDEGWYALLARCFESLGREQCDLLAAYYEDLPHAERMKRRLEMAARLGVTINNLRLKIHRLRLDLEKCVRGASRAAA
jgi:hypothetical protein